LRDDSGGHTGDNTTGEVESLVLCAGEGVFRLAGRAENVFGGQFEAVRSSLARALSKVLLNSHGELGHGVWDLLEQDGTEAVRDQSNATRRA